MMAAAQSLENDTWVIWNGDVYDVSNFLAVHPGGKDLILRYGGKDITCIMESTDIHKHSATAYSLFKEFKILKLKDQNIDNNDHDGWKEAIVDWNQGMICQVYRLGCGYMKWVHSPVDRQFRLFNSDFLEYFSKTAWYVVPIVWLPIISLLLFLSFHNILQETAFPHPSKVCLLLLFLLVTGIFIWTLVEYLLHRFLFHLYPPADSPYWITFHFLLHGQHHKTPFDPKRLVFPPAAAAIIALPFYVVLTRILPLGFGQGIFAGGLCGYVIYDLIHYYLHHGNPSIGYFQRLKQYHVNHHFVDQNNGFGISSRLWDIPFGTLPEDVAHRQ